MNNDEKERDAAIAEYWDNYPDGCSLIEIWNASRKHRDLQIADELAVLNRSIYGMSQPILKDYIADLRKEMLRENAEPKVSPSLEDAAREYFWAHGGNTLTEPNDLIDMVASFARQQRRDAVAELVRRLKDDAYKYGDADERDFMDGLLEAVAKELETK